MKTRPLTPVVVHPDLPAEVKGMLLGSLASGNLAILCDFLLERFSDRDAADAIRANERERAALVAASLCYHMEQHVAPMNRSGFLHDAIMGGMSADAVRREELARRPVAEP